jgi:hypothetical protein
MRKLQKKGKNRPEIAVQIFEQISQETQSLTKLLLAFLALAEMLRFLLGFLLFLSLSKSFLAFSDGNPNENLERGHTL